MGGKFGGCENRDVRLEEIAKKERDRNEQRMIKKKGESRGWKGEELDFSLWA